MHARTNNAQAMAKEGRAAHCSSHQSISLKKTDDTTGGNGENLQKTHASDGFSFAKLTA
jgi:hypothetical protein